MCEKTGFGILYGLFKHHINYEVIIVLLQIM